MKADTSGDPPSRPTAPKIKHFAVFVSHPEKGARTVIYDR